MELGKGIKPERSSTILAQATAGLDGEEILFVCRCANLVPFMDLLIVSESRIAGLASGNGAVQFSATHEEVLSVEPNEQWSRLGIHTGHGVTVFKGVNRADLRRVQHHLDTAGALRKSAAEAGSALESAAGSDLARPVGARYGREVSSGSFAGSTIKIYAGGFVRVSSLWFKSSTPYERLMGIEASANVSKKSGLGRGAAAALTMGVSLAGSNKRGDVYLTIATDRTTHVLRAEPPTAHNIRESKKLEGAGLAVLREVERMEALEASRQAAVQSACTPGGDVSSRLRALGDLLAQGLLTQEECEARRVKIIDSI